MIDAESPVKDPSDFVGHAGLVRRLFSRIGAERPQSVALIGGTKSGKTSLLSFVSDEGIKGKFLDGAERFVFVQACAGCRMTESPDSFLAGLHELLPAVAGARANRYEGVSQAIDALHASGKRLVILLDDFHFITQNERFPLEFFSFLRSMANNYNLAYVTTSFLELQKLCVVKDVQESPFFNIFTNLPLGMLAPADAKTLLEKITKLTDAAAGRVAEWCGSSAYILKKAAARLEGESAPEKLTDEDLERILSPEIAPFFVQIVSLLPPNALKGLQAIAKGRGVDQSEAHYLSSLIKQGFLVERDGDVSCFSPAFLAFLRKGLSPRMLKGKD
jgi:hypothetical protein